MTASVTSTEAHEGPVTSGFWALTLGSIGVVFGDIGTSPLYAFREAVDGARPGRSRSSRAIVLGVLSLILWALFIVVTAKYVLLLLRADNNGEGGTLSLMALGQRALGPAKLAVAGARRGRRLDVHRRFHDHAGDFGAVGGRRPQARHAGARTLCGAADGLHPGRAVLGAEQRHGARGVGFRAGDGGLVRGAGGAGPRSHQRRSVGAGGDQSLLRHPVPADARHDRPGDAGRGVPGGDRRRGALCRSRPFRTQADPGRLDLSSCCRRC